MKIPIFPLKLLFLSKSLFNAPLGGVEKYAPLGGVEKFRIFHTPFKESEER